MARFTQPELHLQRADLDEVAVTQQGLLDRLAVDRGQRVGLGAEAETLSGNQIELQMLVPNAVLLQLEAGGRGAPNPYRKTAGHPCGARLLSGQNLKLHH